jgi:membrane-associated protein
VIATVVAVLGAIGIDPNQLLRNAGFAGLLAVVFAESGILLGFFLPGDSLLFTAGLLSATTNVLPPFPVLIVGCAVAAIAGDQVGYLIGRRFGPNIFDRPDSRLFKHEHLERAGAFFERHGSKTIVLARFVPVVRTFVPVVAGASGMQHRRFTVYNVIGGVLWTSALLTLGWVLGKRFPGIGADLDVAILVIVLVSLIPLAVELVRHRRARNRTSG